MLQIRRPQSMIASGLPRAEDSDTAAIAVLEMLRQGELNGQIAPSSRR